MHPFGETVLAWRLARGLTQADLARAARIPRPNLSAIERGDREVTLKTLRALALALDLRPGILADGIAPQTEARPLSRSRLERIARATARDVASADARESVLAEQLRRALSARMAVGRRRSPVRPGAGADRAYFRLRSSERAETVASLVDRVGLEIERE